MKKFRIILGLIFVLMFLSTNVYAVEPWVSMIDKLNEIYEIVLDTNDKVIPVPCEGAPVAKTGQTISYEPGDDGDIQAGVELPIPRFTDNLDDTITDNLTKLQWTKDANLFGDISWISALTSCNDCSVGNYTNWRLPNIKELLSLTDYSEWNLSLPNGHPFINTRIGHYWSSTSFAPEGIQEHGNIIWLVEFKGGRLGTGHRVGGSPWFVWCVRSGE